MPPRPSNAVDPVVAEQRYHDASPACVKCFTGVLDYYASDAFHQNACTWGGPVSCLAVAHLDYPQADVQRDSDKGTIRIYARTCACPYSKMPARQNAMRIPSHCSARRNGDIAGNCHSRMHRERGADT
jgi:hypothetical protein